MIRAWLRYSILLILAFFMYIIFSGYLFFVIFVLVLSLPVLSIAAMLIGRRSIKLQIKVKKDGIYLQYQGGVVFPLVTIATDVKIENVFFQEKEEKQIRFLTNGKQSDFLLYQAKEDMGRIRVRFETYTIKDMLGLWRKKIQKPSGKYVIIYPPFLDNLPQQIEAELSDDTIVSENGLPDQSGFMEDKHEVREYYPGDDIRRIHHKLSYKMAKTMIREFTAFHQEDMRIYLDFNGNKEECAFVFASFVRLAIGWIEKGMEGVVSWAAMDGDYEVTILDDRMLRASMNEILSHPKVDGVGDVAISTTYAHVFVISAKGITSMKQEEGGGRYVES